MALPSDLSSGTRVRRSSALNFDPSKTVTIHVGTSPNDKSYHVNETLICKHSEFFRCALNGRLAESEERIVKLSGDSPDTVHAYLNLVHTGHIPTIEDDLGTNDTEPSDTVIFQKYHDLFSLYILAEKFQDGRAKDAVVNAILDVASKAYKIPRKDQVSLIYSGTMAGSPVRRLVSDLWSCVNKDCSFGDLPYECIVDIAHALLHAREKNRWEDVFGNRTQYMEKSEEETKVSEEETKVSEEETEVSEEEIEVSEEETTRKRPKLTPNRK